MAHVSGTSPVLSTSWDTDSLDTGAIHDELGQLWTELSTRQREPLPHAEDVSEHRLVSGNNMMRANTLNLIAVAKTQDIAEMITSTVAQLRDFLPSRTVVFITDPSIEHELDWQVNISLHEGLTVGDSPSIFFESITIHANPSLSPNLASIVAPLMMAELPTFLWWPSGDFEGSAVFNDLVELTDRLVIDSARLGSDARAISQARTLLDDEDDPLVGDFTWLRLQPWRTLLAQFFDPLETRAALDEISRVNIAYAEVREDNGSGFAAALLTVGWLASRLGWEIIDQLEPRKSGGWTAFMKATNAEGRARNIQIRLTPDASRKARFSLRSVELVANGPSEGVFRIMRTDKDDLITSSETAHAPYVSRMVYSRRDSNVELLGEELQRFGADKVFEDSIRLAVQLIP